MFRARAVDAMLALIKDDLAALGVRHDVFTSEAALIEAGRIEQALARLERRGLVYTGTLPPPKGKPSEDWEPVPLLLFRATAFGDDVDRPLKSSRRASGPISPPTSPITSTRSERGAEELIDVWGADHGGYVKRMQAGVRALSDGRVALDVKVCQLVNLLDGGQPLRMSKRAGRIVTLRDVVDEVGKDVVRFIMLTPQERRAARLRPRQGDRAVARQSRMVRAVRPCPDLLGPAPCRDAGLPGGARRISRMSRSRR